MKLTRREKFLLILLLIVVIGAGYYSLFFRPFNEKLTSVQSEISDLKSKVSDYKMKSTAFSRLKEKVDELEQEVTTYLEENNIDSKYNAAVIIVYLEELFSKYNVKQLEIGLAEPIEEQFYKSASLNISFSGSYENIKLVINELESGKFKQYITNIVIGRRTVSSEEDDQNSNILNVSITFTHIFETPGGSDEDYPFMKDGNFNKNNPFS